MLNAMINLIGLLILAVTWGSFFYFYMKHDDDELDKTTVKSKRSKAIIFTIVAFILIILSISFTIIPTGYTGVRITFGQVDEVTLHNGFNTHIPFVQSIEMVNNKQQDIVFDETVVKSETLERNEVTFSGITVTYQINPEKSSWIYANVSDYENGLVSSTLVSSAIKTSSKTLTPIDVTNRSILEPIAKENVQSSLDEKYGKDVVIVNKVVIAEATFDSEYNEKIAKKQQAQMDYETQQIENSKNVEKAEADAKVTETNAKAAANAKLIEAEAEAEANKKLSESLDNRVLTNRYYDTWNGVLPSTIAGDDTSVIIKTPDTDNTPKKENTKESTE